MDFLNQYGLDECVYIHRDPPQVCGGGIVVSVDAWNNNAISISLSGRDGWATAKRHEIIIAAFIFFYSAFSSDSSYC